MLPPLGAQAPSHLGLAQWLVNGKHPLTARVMINRIWQEHFGHGLSSYAETSTGGIAYSPPITRWLAQEWTRSGWDETYPSPDRDLSHLPPGQWLTARDSQA